MMFVSTFGQRKFEPTMRRAVAITTSTRPYAQQGLARTRQSETFGETYSPTLCIGLLLTIALIASICG